MCYLGAMAYYVVVPMDLISDTVTVAIIGGIAALIGHLSTSRRGDASSAIEALRAQLIDVRSRQTQLEQRVDDLLEGRERERARAWAAIEYARALVRYIRRHVPVDAPEVPAPPPEIDSDM